MLITAREHLCCPLLKLALSECSQPNIILLREKCLVGEQTFKCDSTTAVGQPPDFFLPLSNIVKIYYKTYLDLATIIIAFYLVDTKVKTLSWPFLRESLNFRIIFFGLKNIDHKKWMIIKSKNHHCSKRKVLIVDLLLRWTRSFTWRKPLILAVCHHYNTYRNLKIKETSKLIKSIEFEPNLFSVFAKFQGEHFFWQNDNL